MNYYEPTDEQQKGWEKFLESRPAHVRAVAEKFQPWTLYRMKSTGHRVTIASFSENTDGSVTLVVNVTGQFNLVFFERAVFGIPPEDLEECDLPERDELVGAALDGSEVEQNIDAIRAIMLSRAK